MMFPFWRACSIKSLSGGTYCWIKALMFIRVFLVLLLLLLDDMLFQPTLTSAAIGRRRVQRRLLWLTVGAETHLEVLLFFLLALQADCDLLDPSELGQRLLVHGHRLFDVGDFFLHFLILRSSDRDEPCTNC